MLNSFPEPYPDELLYSVLARFHIRRGNTAAKTTLRELFGDSKVTPAYDLPSHIDRLVSNLPLYNIHTAEDLIYNNTLFPYYAAFLPEDRIEKILVSMRSNQGGDILTRCGILSSKISPPQYFRFCPLCNQEDMKEFGECYWHRLHQLPGVHVCGRHRVFLENSSVLTHNKHELIAANRINCKAPSCNVGKNCSDKEINGHCEFVKEAVWILTNHQKIGSLSTIKNRYLNLLQKQGLASPTGRVFQKELVKAFISYYGHCYLQQEQSDIDVYQDNTWLSGIVRKYRKSFHPINHILMIRFLSSSLDDFFAMEEPKQPFGEGPWPCLNIASGHYMENTIKDIAIVYSTDAKRRKGIFRCSCGFSYIRWESDVLTDDRFSFDKVLEYGLVWEARLKEYMRHDIGLRDMSRRLKVDPKTIKRHIAAFELENLKVVKPEEVTKSSLQDLDTKTRLQKRTIWENLLKQYPEKSMKRIRAEAEDVFGWLYRNDKEWLYSLQYNKKTISNQAFMRVDWEERDKQLYEQACFAITKLKASNTKPIRITVSSVGKLINKRTLLEKHLDKLPLTMECLARNVESVEEYQQRKVEWAIRLLVSANQELRKWKIVKTAGIKNYKTPEIDELVSREMEVICSKIN